MELCPKCHVDYDGRKPPSQKGTTISTAHRDALMAGHRRWRIEQGHQVSA